MRCHAVGGRSNEMFSDFREHVIAVPQVMPEVSNVSFDGPGANEDFDASGDLDIKNNLTITSTGHVVIDALGLDRVFQVFVALHLAAGKLPFQRHGLTFRPLADQDLAIANY